MAYAATEGDIFRRQPSTFTESYKVPSPAISQSSSRPSSSWSSTSRPRRRSAWRSRSRSSSGRIRWSS